MGDVSHPAPVRILLAGVAAMMWSLALFGVVQAVLGHPPPGHPWAEVTLSALGVAHLGGALGGGEDRSAVWTLVAMGGALIGLTAALLWLAMSIVAP